MKKMASYPKITTKSNITITQTQNISINSPKAFGITALTIQKKLFKAPAQSKAKAKTFQMRQEDSKSKIKINHHKSQPHLDSRRLSSGVLNKHIGMVESKEETVIDKKAEIKKLQEKLKELQKKIETIKQQKKPKAGTSQRSQSTTKTNLVHNTVLNNFKKKNTSNTKILKKSQSDKYLVMAPKSKSKKNDKSSIVTMNKQDEESQMIHKFVSQVTRSELGIQKAGKKQWVEEEKVVYYIERAHNSISKNYLMLFREHLQQSIQTIKYLQSVRRPSAKQLQKHSVNLPPCKHKYSVILDLDQTLIHCNQSLGIPHDVTLNIKFPTGEKIDAGINIRPFTNQFLKSLSQIAQVIVFTASHECYANVVLDHLDAKKNLISHRLFRNHCWQTEEGVYIKDLRVLKNRNLANILLVDNAAYSYFYQLENGIPIIPFYDDKDDNELVQLIDYLRAMIRLKKSEEKYSLQDLNHEYFQLAHYSGCQNIEELTNKLYRQAISKYKAIIH